MEPMVVPQGRFTLARYPERAEDRLRAWDAADELVLGHLDEIGRPHEGDRVLVVNDGSGALSVALARHRPVLLSDSYLAQRAVVANLRSNGIDPELVTLVDPLAPLDQPFDVVVVKVPKSLARLEDELRRLASALHPDTVTIGAAMTRDVHASTIELFERFVGPTTTSLARKKARLLLATVDPGRPSAGGPPPAHGYPIESHRITVVGRPGVFGADRLDAGTRMLLDHLPAIPEDAHVADLGCGTGVLGVAAALAQPSCTVTMLDESWAAVDAARATATATLGPDSLITAPRSRILRADGAMDDEQRTPERAMGSGGGARVRCVVGAGLFDLAQDPPIEPGSLDLVLTNPPFHEDRAVGDATAWAMFGDAARALRRGGELWVVGNRHLGYHAKLARRFGHCDGIASTPKFVVLRATRR